MIKSKKGDVKVRGYKEDIIYDLIAIIRSLIETKTMEKEELKEIFNRALEINIIKESDKQKIATLLDDINPKLRKIFEENF